MGKYQLDQKGKAAITRFHEKNTNFHTNKKERLKTLLKHHQKQQCQNKFSK